MKLTRSLLLLRRLLAFLYDCFLLIALFFAVTAVALFLNDGKAIESVLYKLTLLPIAGVFFVWFWKNGGQTLGMRAWRIKLVNNEGSAAGWTQCTLHFVFGVVFFGFTYLFMLLNRQQSALHDHLSNTRIVNEKDF